MRKVAFTIMFSLSAFVMFGQDVTGQWNGMLKVPGAQLRLVFHVEKTETGYASTMDSPDQGANGLPVATTTFEDATIRFTIPAAGIEYQGVLGSDGVITGNFNQAGQSFPMNLTREVIEKEILKRPQEPTKPYPYHSEDVTFKNEKAGIELAGTLTLPNKDGVFPVVMLISGSGPQNRDEELLGHKPFLVLSDYLTRNGIAVLRYDDRGTASSKGNFGTATSKDFATDVEAGVTYLMGRKEIDKKKIGLIGHSEGGIVAPMVAANSKKIAFIVLLAGTGIPGGELLLLQQALISKVYGVSDEDLAKSNDYNKGAYAIVSASSNIEQLKTDLTAYYNTRFKDNPDFVVPEGMTGDELIKSMVDQLANPWMQFFIQYDPAPTLEKVKCPVLALNGEKDLQVPPKENLGAIEAALKKGGNKKVTTQELPGLNHLFQECTTGSPEEYSTIEQTMSPAALMQILTWVNVQTK
ncbi:MAG TPA: alpha/beta fold hydrolase [Saprospiraceae bacterium]|nr:alpha/beta fold hydrolase [Saprospiraceae bacterium]